MKSILVTGSDGQLGLCIKDKVNHYLDLDIVFTNSKELDITNRSEVNKLFKKNKFDFCVNCAAYTAVDKAESEHKKAEAVNTVGVKNLAKACKLSNTTLVHISTDFVFDGNKKEPYTEEDETNPINVYGKTKRNGEIEIETTLKKYFILRTSWLYSQYGSNFLRTMLKLSKEREELSVVNDQLGSPTNANNLAELIVKLIVANSKSYGTYHFSDNGATSWYGFAREIFSCSGAKVHLNSITSFSFYTTAKRPKFSVLDTSKISKEFGIIGQDWKDALNQLFFLTNMSSDQ